MSEFRQYLGENNRFQSYLYSYPHKTAYRDFAEKIDLQALWLPEKKQALYLYTHIPFCRLRCAYCNIFSLSNPQDDLVQRYLNQIQTEAEVMREVLGDFSFANYSIGGGTPSHLTLAQLDQLFNIYTHTLGVDSRQTPGSIEISPDTITDEKLAFFAQQGVQRISIGIQSFIESEARSMGRMQPSQVIEPLLEKIVSFAFPVFNLDLIYGIAGQTPESWLASLQKAVSFQPDELFLYPLYVRPQTALFRKSAHDRDSADIRPTLYTLGRDFLKANGYIQESMRLFRRARTSLPQTSEYSCQEDGMIGLGVNARSYTRDVHYSSEYAVSKSNIGAIINQYVNQSPTDFTTAEFGIRLSLDDKKRRYLIKSILKADGMDCAHYQQLFTTEVFSDFPELGDLLSMNLAEKTGSTFRLNEAGISYSDLIGHWFISAEVRQKMREYVQK